MTGFLTELGKRLAERWVAVLVIPGALFVSVAVAAVILRHRRWADTSLLWQELTEFTATGQDGAGLTRGVVVLLAVLIASAGAGLVAQVLRRPVEHALTGRWPFFLRLLAAVLTTRRKNKWTRRDGDYQQAQDKDQQESLGELRTRRNNIALTPPRFPTWLGDRLHAPASRVSNEYGLELGSSWPRLWLLLPDSTRQPLIEARERLDNATALGGWASLYLALGAVWWPSAVLGVCLGFIAWRRARATGDVYADLVEATYDVHLAELVNRFGHAEGLRPISLQRGRELTERFRKGT